MNLAATRRLIVVNINTPLRTMYLRLNNEFRHILFCYCLVLIMSNDSQDLIELSKKVKKRSGIYGIISFIFGFGILILSGILIGSSSLSVILLGFTIIIIFFCSSYGFFLGVQFLMFSTLLSEKYQPTFFYFYVDFDTWKIRFLIIILIGLVLGSTTGILLAALIAYFLQGVVFPLIIIFALIIVILLTQPLSLSFSTITIRWYLFRGKLKNPVFIVITKNVYEHIKKRVAMLMENNQSDSTVKELGIIDDFIKYINFCFYGIGEGKIKNENEVRNQMFKEKFEISNWKNIMLLAFKDPVKCIVKFNILSKKRTGINKKISGLFAFLASAIVILSFILSFI